MIINVLKKPLPRIKGRIQFCTKHLDVDRYELSAIYETRMLLLLQKYEKAHICITTIILKRYGYLFMNVLHKNFNITGVLIHHEYSLYRYYYDTNILFKNIDEDHLKVLTNTSISCICNHLMYYNKYPPKNMLRKLKESNLHYYSKLECLRNFNSTYLKVMLFEFEPSSLKKVDNKFKIFYNVLKAIRRRFL